MDSKEKIENVKLDLQNVATMTDFEWGVQSGNSQSCDQSCGSGSRFSEKQWLICTTERGKISFSSNKKQGHYCN